MKSKLLFIASAFLVSLASCTKDADNSATISDESISSMTTSSDLVLIHSAMSDNSKWNIKMNDIAAKAYADGNLNYPANSMIVKEKHDADGNISGYDVMYKAPADDNSNNGWLWTQLGKNGHVIYGTNYKGATCQNCHANPTKTVVSQ